MTAHLKPVREALSRIREAPIDGFDSQEHDDELVDGMDRYGCPPPALPDDCPVTAVGTEDGVFYFLTALGELRGLTADKVANKHIVGMFAPFGKSYLEKTWPTRKLVKKKTPEGQDIIDAETGQPEVEWITTGWKTEIVQTLLMDTAARRGVWNAREKVRGRGAWRDDAGGLILHCGNHVLINGAWSRPGMHGNLVYPTAPALPRPLYDDAFAMTAEELAPDLTGELRSRGAEIARDASPARLLLELIKTWNWARPKIDPVLALGWIMAAPFSGALDYRPIVWITGGKAAGKTSLLKLLEGLFDGGILQTPNASEAAIRQTLGQQSLPVNVDEAEADRDNRKMMALVTLARLAATSQGNILRGGQDHKATEFRATSCFLFSSILVPPLEPADKSRLAVLELNRLPAGARSPIGDRHKRELNAIGAWLRRRFVSRWHDWPGVLESFTDAMMDYGDQGSRAADQFGTLRAAAHVALEEDLLDDRELVMWGQLLGREALAETADDDDEGPLCLAHLMTMQVTLDRGNKVLEVADWVAQAVKPVPVGDLTGDTRVERTAANAALARIGLKVVDNDKPGMERLAIANKHQGLSKVFEGSKYGEGVWAQALGRLEGAERGKNLRIGHIQHKCTLVPLRLAISRDSDEIAAPAPAMEEA